MNQILCNAALDLLEASPPFWGRDRLRYHIAERYPPGAARRSRGMDGYMHDYFLANRYERQLWFSANRHVLASLGHLLEKGDTFLDIGANLGDWSLGAASLVGPQGHIVAIEPNPFVYRRLVASVHMNGLDHVIQPLNLAATNRTSVLWLEPGRGGHETSRIVKTPGQGTIEISARRIDDVLQGEGRRVIGMKIDVEGHESSTIEGALETLHKDHPWIIAEFNVQYYPSAALADWTVHHTLAQLGYHPFSLHGRELPADFVQDKPCDDVLFRWA